MHLSTSKISTVRTCLPLLFLVFTCTAFNQVLAQQKTPYVNPRNPCHPDKKSYGDDSNCLVYRIPPKLCTKCKLNQDNIDNGGKFDKCYSIFNIPDDGCRKQIEKYATLNPCDKERNKAVKNYSQNIIALDYFIYSVCEECCDCVRTKSKVSEYKQRKKANTLFEIDTRANCGTHAAADICMVWPKVRWVINHKEPFPTQQEINKMKDICPPLRKWRNDRKSGSGAGLTPKQINTVPGYAQTFLKQFIDVAKCKKRSLWQSCVSLEQSQRRI